MAVAVDVCNAVAVAAPSPDVRSLFLRSLSHFYCDEEEGSYTEKFFSEGSACLRLQYHTRTHTHGEEDREKGV